MRESTTDITLTMIDKDCAQAKMQKREIHLKKM